MMEIQGCLYFLILINLSRAQNWEVSVCLGDRVESLDSTGETQSTTSLGLLSSLHTPDVLALDSLTGQLFLADSTQANTSIFSVRLSDPPLHDPPRSIHQQANHGRVRGVAYDPVDRSVYWTTGIQGRILRLSLVNDNDQTVTQIIHNFSKEVPHGIAVDSCRRKLYWSNCNITGPSIEVSTLDGQDKRVLVETGLFQPLGIAISQGDGWLYWADEGAGYSFTVERIKLDGTGRQVLVRSRHQQPIALAVVPGEHVYWTDQLRQAIWSLDISRIKETDVVSSVEPVLIKEYKESKPSGLVALRQDSNLDPDMCMNVITLKNQMGIENGERSRRHCPIDYCLHNGTCSYTQTLSCVCRLGYLGNRCQYEARLCSAYCLDVTAHTDEALNAACQCSQVASVYSEVKRALDGSQQNSFDWKLTSICLSTLCSVLLVVVVVLTFRTYKLSKRPKLRRRYTITKNNVNKNQPADRSCDIGDIENCCNMNICETPCYEPEFRTPGRYSGNKGTRSGEKKSLISDMEVPEPSRPPLDSLP